MSIRPKTFDSQQIEKLKASAQALQDVLEKSIEPVADELLKGSLGESIRLVLHEKCTFPLNSIPHFDKMTRGYFPEIEGEYFNFYSLALYGKSA